MEKHWSRAFIINASMVKIQTAERRKYRYRRIPTAGPDKWGKPRLEKLVKLQVG